VPIAGKPVGPTAFWGARGPDSRPGSAAASQPSGPASPATGVTGSPDPESRPESRLVVRCAVAHRESAPLRAERAASGPSVRLEATAVAAAWAPAALAPVTVPAVGGPSWTTTKAAYDQAGRAGREQRVSELRRRMCRSYGYRTPSATLFVPSASPYVQPDGWPGRPFRVIMPGPPPGHRGSRHAPRPSLLRVHERHDAADTATGQVDHLLLPATWATCSTGWAAPHRTFETTCDLALRGRAPRLRARTGHPRRGSDRDVMAEGSARVGCWTSRSPTSRSRPS